MIHRAIYCVWHNNLYTLFEFVCLYIAMNTLQQSVRRAEKGVGDEVAQEIWQHCYWYLSFIHGIFGDGGGGAVFVCFLLLPLFLFLLSFILYFIETPLNPFESPSFINFSRDDNKFIRIMTGWVFDIIRTYRFILNTHNVFYIVCTFVFMFVRISFLLCPLAGCVHRYCFQYLNHSWIFFLQILPRLLFYGQYKLHCVYTVHCVHVLYGIGRRIKFYRTHLFKVHAFNCLSISLPACLPVHWIFPARARSLVRPSVSSSLLTHRICRKKLDGRSINRTMQNQILTWLKTFNRERRWDDGNDDDDDDQSERASERAHRRAHFAFSMSKILSIWERIQQPIPYCVIVYFSIVIRLLLLARMLDASGICAQHTNTNNIRNCECLCFCCSVIISASANIVCLHYQVMQ